MSTAVDEDEDDTATLLAELNAEVSLLRGIREPGLSAPTLDFEAPSPRARARAKPDDINDLEERRQTQLRTSEVAHARWEREQFMATLKQRDSEARDERQALLHYLEALRERPDEAGESLRGPDFIKMVDKLASEGRQERSPVDFAGTGNVASLLEAVSDPRLREELLEV